MKPSACWTCRLRHKKCDESLPICGGCAALEIDCHYSSEKPQWMESEVRRREATTRLKAQVKRSAKRRRGIAQMRSIASGIDVDPGPGPDPGRIEPSPDSSSKQTHSTSVVSSSEHTTLSTAALTELEMGFISVYMDYIFPILFPFYRPYITQGGRSWLLSLAMTNHGFMSSIITMSSLFLSFIPADLSVGHGSCTSRTWDELQKQASDALGSIQRDLQRLRERGVENSLSDSVHLLANMMQQLGFELAIMPSGNWQTHLDAATGLFEQILEHHGKTGSTPQISAVLSNLSRPSWAADALNTEQGAFRFFSSILLIADIISSTVLNRRAKLSTYHSELRRSGLRQQPSLDLEEITGCQAWVLLAISDISTLSRWKTDQMMSGELSRTELISRASSIDEVLHKGLERIDRHGERDQSSESSRPLESLLNQLGSPSGQPYDSSAGRLPLTRIWIHAARTYLLSVKLDGATKASELQTSVEQATSSFGMVTSTPWLRWLAWPLCVTGVNASKEQRPAVRGIIDSMCSLKAFGTIRSTFDIIEKVWQSQDAGKEYLNLSTCLSSLGYKTLLV
ncbi:fungal-specific transcription factor domain-containing protein [Fusarium flagelliforme]|uniref:fungal-specific transcription factor domain-containing protein n=1 Tax=Fusarium flagelliforme TaxID=2675880 RepID=UPI001E8D9651|nr:fungal-specific transcription factor domain-containing protein [Fusarium flagelliforme]KAH7180032.1 fungal-specific transcription factor domain-containing protein [Fusarium flagelliforme]